jgi:hypothetical protein
MYRAQGRIARHGLARLLHFVEVGRHQQTLLRLTMSISIEALAVDGPMGPRRRTRTDRRVRGRLRELCEEVLASYRLAQGQDIVTPEEREAAEQTLRTMTPRLAR